MQLSLDRRQALGGALGVAMTGGSARAGALAGDAFDATSLMSDVERYASFGVHQSGSEGDRKTGEWIVQRLRGLGLEVSTTPIDVPFFDAKSVGIRGAGWNMDGLAQAPVTSTGGAGVTGPLRMRYDEADDVALAGSIAVIPLTFGRHAGVQAPAIAVALAAAARAGAKAAVLITTGPTGLPIALNAPARTAFSGLPVICVGSQHASTLIPRARAGETATLVIDGASGTRAATNIVASRPGPGRAVVVTTPLSGWFRCAGERGSGIAAWLAFAASLPRAFPKLEFIFAGNVGHECDNLGSHQFLKEVAPPPERVALWHHFGSGFATRDWQEAGPGFLLPLPSADAQRWLIASAPFLSPLKKATSGLPGFEQPYAADAKSAAGEAAPILAAGYDRLVANYGAHRYFHTERDGPETTSGELISASARALHQAVTEILSAV